MGHGTETLDRGFVTKSSDPNRLLTFLTIRRRSAARDVGIVKETVRNIDIRDMAQKHWILDLSQSQVILVEY